jgi:hypothetical protein
LKAENFVKGMMGEIEPMQRDSERTCANLHELNSAIPDSGRGDCRFQFSTFRMQCALIFLCAVFLGALSCRAFVLEIDADTGARLHWPVEESVPRRMAPIRFFLVDEGWSATNRAAELNAVRAAFGQWQSISGTLLRFEEGGVLRTRADMIDPADGTNIVRWINTRGLINGGTVSLDGILGLTLASYRADGTMLGADIVLNGAEFDWFTDFNDRNSSAFFAETTLLHEIGHLLGLDHSPAGAALMHPRGGPGVDARFGIGADEIAFARASYGVSAADAALAHLAGKVTMRGAAVFGTAVAVEDAAGNLLATTVSGAGGDIRFQRIAARGAERPRVAA